MDISAQMVVLMTTRTETTKSGGVWGTSLISPGVGCYTSSLGVGPSRVTFT